jgi:hypothetical protein
VPTRKTLKKSSVSVSVELIERRIYLIRGHKVMIDADLAELYEVPTKRFNEQVRRNAKRFPEELHVSVNEGRGRVFEIAICDLKHKPRRFEVANCDLKTKPARS